MRELAYCFASVVAEVLFKRVVVVVVLFIRSSIPKRRCINHINQHGRHRLNIPSNVGFHMVKGRGFIFLKLIVSGRSSLVCVTCVCVCVFKELRAQVISARGIQTSGIECSHLAAKRSGPLRFSRRDVLCSFKCLEVFRATSSVFSLF